MSTQGHIYALENPLLRHGGQTWHELHSEREDLCEALLKHKRPVHDQLAGRQENDENQESTYDVEWNHRQLLQARLRQLDDALDRLIAGSYGNCSNCGRWIEDSRLAADPALPYCIECQRRSETERRFQTM